MIPASPCRMRTSRTPDEVRPFGTSAPRPRWRLVSACNRPLTAPTPESGISGPPAGHDCSQSSFALSVPAFVNAFLKNRSRASADQSWPASFGCPAGIHSPASYHTQPTNAPAVVSFRSVSGSEHRIAALARPAPRIKEQ